MLVALTVKRQEPKSYIEKLINRVRGDRIVTEINSVGGVALRDITYISRTDKINYEKLASALGESQNILCEKNTVLPSGFCRFENREFKSLLSINLGVFILSELKKSGVDLPVGFYDPEGVWGDHLKRLSRYNNNILAVTDNLTRYDKISEEILSGSGAVIIVTDNRHRLADCKIIIAPDGISEPLCCLGNTVVLAGEKPSLSLPCVCYYDYSFRTPNTFASLKPARFSAEYFSGALFSLARQYELGSVVPTSCSNDAFSQTLASLVKYLKNS